MENSKQKQIASPDGAISFLFGVFGLLLWYMPNHQYSTGMLLTVGLMWIVLSAGALAASLLNVKIGRPKGNINLIATLLLGFFPGLNTLVVFSAKMMNIPYEPRIFGLIYMIGSVFCFGVMVKRFSRALYRTISTFMVGAGLLFLGMGDLLSMPVLMKTGGWAMFVFALLSFYYGLSVMYVLYGGSLPQGPSLDSLIKK
ncbi:MAG: hypothetical protein HUJ54_14920 [Erysipelotrichaceae bacterium]|nr:hypothetical protein [Erysipelotrichaceae bacterium]